MKEIYLLNQRIMNGTVTMGIESYGFETEELANKVKGAIEEKTKNPSGPFLFTSLCENIKKIQVFENEEEVPILNRQNNNQKQEETC